MAESEPPFQHIISEIEKRYLVSVEDGFMVSKPEENLPGAFRPFEELANNLTSLVESRQLRDRVDKLNVDDTALNIDQLDKNQLLLAHLILSFIQMAYVWQNGDGEKDVAKKLPRCIAVPLCEISDKLGMQPIISYPSMILANWKQVKEGEHEMQNLVTLYDTPGGDGASWFILTHNCIEKKFAPIMKLILLAVSYAEEKNIKLLTKELKNIPGHFIEMQKLFKRIKERLDPRQFYENLRLFYSGWDSGSKVLPHGLIFEGVNENKPMQHTGGSAAQSTTLQVVDAVLGVEHKGDQKAFIEKERDYMLREHREFITYLEGRSSVRETVRNSDDKALKKAYDGCIQSLMSFRTFHKDWIVKEFIIDQQKKQVTNVSLEDIGTGGTSLKTFLAGVITTTEEAKVK